jgi:hypothetical protein
LIKLGLETPESLHGRIQNGDLHLFIALARVFEASASHEAPESTIYLASGKTLSRQHCPEIALGHFNHIHDLKESGEFANFLPLALIDAATAKSWLFRIIQPLKSSNQD